MTLVLSSFAIAAPGDKPEQKEPKKLIEYEKNSSQLPPAQSPVLKFDNNEDIAPEEKETFFYSHKSGISLRAGAAADFDELNKTDGDKKAPIVLGGKFMLASENSKHQEYGVDLLSGNKSVMYINGGYKYITDHTSSLRPYYKLGAAMRFDEGDHLETPFDFKSYSLMASFGLEDTWKNPHSTRVDLDILWGKEDFLAMVTVGWTLGF